MSRPTTWGGILNFFNPLYDLSISVPWSKKLNNNTLQDYKYLRTYGIITHKTGPNTFDTYVLVPTGFGVSPSNCILVKQENLDPDSYYNRVVNSQVGKEAVFMNVGTMDNILKQYKDYVYAHIRKVENNVNS